MTPVTPCPRRCDRGLLFQESGDPPTRFCNPCIPLFRPGIQLRNSDSTFIRSASAISMLSGSLEPVSVVNDLRRSRQQDRATILPIDDKNTSKSVNMHSAVGKSVEDGCNNGSARARAGRQRLPGATLVES